MRANGKVSGILCCIISILITLFILSTLPVNAQTDSTPADTSAEISQVEEDNQAEPPPAEEEPPPEEAPPSEEGTNTSSLDSSAAEIEGSSLGISIPAPENLQFYGAATSKIPITVPPGRKGISPNISLIYNNLQANGWIGVGWDIDMGSIQRLRKWGLDCSANDYIMVKDGFYSELIPRTDWGTNYYGEKIEGNFAKYCYQTATGGWTVTKKDGTIYFYGTTSASRQGGCASGTFKWCLDKVKDTNGNYMTITYTKDQGEIYLDRIDYTGNAGIGTTNYVKFYLETRTDKPPMYTLNKLVTTAKRLNRIETYSNGLLQRKYVMTYEYSGSTGRSTLTSVTLYGNDGTTSLPPVEMDWSEASLFESGEWASGLYGGWTSLTAYIRMADVNGDGKADIVLGPNSSGNWYVMLSTGTGFVNQGAWKTGAYAGWASDRIHMVDVNGDGKADVVLGPEHSTGKWYVMLSTGSSFQNQGLWGQNPWWGTVCSYAQYFNGLADVNGDGKVDIVTTVYLDEWCQYPYWYVMLSTGSSFANGVSWMLGVLDRLQLPIKMVDVNGDGRSDIMVGPDTDGNLYVMRSTGYSFVEEVWATGFNPNGLTVRRPDLNGDGKRDILLGPDSNGNWYVWLSTGTSFVYQGAWITGAYGGWVDLQSRIRMINVNADGKADVVLGPNSNGKWFVMLSTGSSFSNKGEWISGAYGGWVDYPDRIRGADVSGDGRGDIVLGPNSSGKWFVLQPAGPVPDLVNTITNEIGGIYTLSYTPSSAHDNTLLPFILQTVSSISKDDGRGNIIMTNYDYSGGNFDYDDREYKGFRKVTTYQMFDAESYESMTETWFHQGYYRKGKIETEIVTSKEGHTRRVDNDWQNIATPGGGYFPALMERTLTVTDVGYSPYSQWTMYVYDQRGNVKEEHKFAPDPGDEIHSYFSYRNFTDKWIVSKPTQITVKNYNLSIVSQKWMDYDSNTGNLLTEEVCKSDTPNTGCTSRNPGQNSITTYQYWPEGNLWIITDPRGFPTTFDYDPTKTFVYTTTKCLDPPSCNNTHITTTEYDTGTGNLKKLIPPHLQLTGYFTEYTYDPLGRKDHEYRPDGGWTSYAYTNFGNPSLQQVYKIEHIIGGQTALDPHTQYVFDGLGRTYYLFRTGPPGKSITTLTEFDQIGRVKKKSNPYFSGYYPDPVYYTTFTYDGLSRVIDKETPDGYHISTDYQGLRKVVTDQNGHPTAYTYDVHQRLKKVEDANGTATEYSYDPTGNLVQVIAARTGTGCIQECPEKNTTTITYDSQSKKRTMSDPDMGFWQYTYDKSGNLETQTDAKSQMITFIYDGLNRLKQKVYPDRTVTNTYDDPAVPYSKGKLTKISDPSGGGTEDSILEYDGMQRQLSTKKKIGTEEKTFTKAYDTAGRVISLIYPGPRTYSYEYDVAGNLLYVKDNASGNHLVDYSNFTARGQHKIANFPKPNNVSVKTTYTYDLPTGRIETLITQKLEGGTPINTYQNLDYQQFDGKGNLETLVDNLNGITHTYGYDPLDRLDWGKGNDGSLYNHDYNYDRIGNIKSKTDVENGSEYIYNYADKPHAIRSVGSMIFPQYDANGNLVQKVAGGVTTDIQWNCDNKPTSITAGLETTTFTYDGNGQRVKKISPSQTVLYFGDLYETRNGAWVKHIFAGKERVASVLEDGRTQFYHPNHVGSASVITNENGDRKEQIEYYPFGTYRDVGSPTGTYDYDAAFPDVFYTFTDQEDDDELGLYKFKARLYDPVLGRFISPDSKVPNPEDLQSLNRYSYCLNNPLRYIDPSGHQEEGAEGAYVNLGGYGVPSYGAYATTMGIDVGNSPNITSDVSDWAGRHSYDEVQNSQQNGKQSMSIIEAFINWLHDPFGIKAAKSSGDPQCAKSGYGDVNVTGGKWGGVTVSVIVTPDGVYVCPGLAATLPGFSVAVTETCLDATPGPIVGVQGTLGISGQGGYSFISGSFFGEAGFGLPPGFSITGVYCFGPFLSE